MVTCITFHRKVGLKRAQVCGSRSRWGSCEDKQVGITLRTEHCRYPRKTSKTSVKNIFIKMLKDVGMVVPKIKGTRL